MDENESKIEWWPRGKLGIGFYIVGFVFVAIALGAILANLFTALEDFKWASEDVAQMGDFLGGVLNPLFSTLAIIAIMYTNYLQRKDFEAQKNIAEGQLLHLQTEAQLRYLVEVYEEAFTEIDKLVKLRIRLEPPNQTGRRTIVWEEGYEDEPPASDSLYGIAMDLGGDPVTIPQKILDAQETLIAQTEIYYRFKKHLEILLHSVRGIFELLKGNQLLRTYDNAFLGLIRYCMGVLDGAKYEFEMKLDRMTLESAAENVPFLQLRVGALRNELNDIDCFHDYIDETVIHIVAAVEKLPSFRKARRPE